MGKPVAIYYAYTQEEARTLLQAHEMAIAVEQFREILRTMAKHGPEVVDPQDVYDRFNSNFADLMGD